jgi:hypothetical protein
MTKPFEVGALVYVRYQDHALFRNADRDMAKPVIVEAWGRLDLENDEYVRLVVACYQESDGQGGQRTKATGLAIVKSTILEMHKVA